MAEPLVRIAGLRKAYGELTAVDGVDLDVAAGEFVVLLCPSGSGKTTILSMLGGFTEPDAGRIEIAKEDVTALPPARRPTATVFQDYALFPHMNVAANVGFGLAMHKVEKSERLSRVTATLAMVGLAGFGGRAIHQLSGGQRQRVALARAIAVVPKVLLLDEPLGALDLALRRQMQEELVQLQKRLGTTFVHVTHDQEEALSIADTVVVLNKGRIEDMGPPRRVYLRPATLFTATFMGESNVLPGQVAEATANRVGVETALGILRSEGSAAPGAAVHVALRPEQLAVAPAADRQALGRARVIDLTFQGNHLRCHARSTNEEGTPLLLRLPFDTPIEIGNEVAIYAKPTDAVVLTR